MIFIVAIGTTHLAIQGFSSQFERHMEQIGHVYLDGLVAAVIPDVRERDAASLARTLKRALDVHVGVSEQRLAIIDPERRVLAHVQREGHRTDFAWPDDVLELPEGVYLDADDGSVWVWRSLGGAMSEGSLGTVVANLDAKGFVGDRERLRWTLVAVDVLVSAVGALVGLMMARRIQRPVTLLAEHMQRGAGKRPLPVDTTLIPADDSETAKLFDAYNRVVTEAGERELLLERMLEQEREALLGRMAATLAHEVRNPLGGIETAIRTLRRYGDQAESREEALDFVERGVVALREVADATLQTRRGGAAGRPLRRQDLLDVERLVSADAHARNVSVCVDADVPDELPVAATEVRQVLLNLLLNAVRATAPGGSVRLRARRTEDSLLFEVFDEGPGPTPELELEFSGGAVPPAHGGLGVAVIVRLVEQLRGRVSVSARSEGGTHVTLHLPIQARSNPG